MDNNYNISGRTHYWYGLPGVCLKCGQSKGIMAPKGDGSGPFEIIPTPNIKECKLDSDYVNTGGFGSIYLRPQIGQIYRLNKYAKSQEAKDYNKKYGNIDLDTLSDNVTVSNIKNDGPEEGFFGGNMYMVVFNDNSKINISSFWIYYEVNTNA